MGAKPPPWNWLAPVSSPMCILGTLPGCCLTLTADCLQAGAVRCGKADVSERRRPVAAAAATTQPWQCQRLALTRNPKCCGPPALCRLPQARWSRAGGSEQPTWEEALGYSTSL